MASALLAATKVIKKKEESIETTTNRSRPSNSNTAVDFPWNIDDIFQADTDRFGQLKDVIKFIVERLDKTTSTVTTIETYVKTKMMQVDK